MSSYLPFVVVGLLVVALVIWKILDQRREQRSQTSHWSSSASNPAQTGRLARGDNRPH